MQGRNFDGTEWYGIPFPLQDAPGGYRWAEGSTRPKEGAFFSWLLRICPYLEQGPLYNQVNWKNWAWYQYPNGASSGPIGTELNGIQLPIVICPSDARTVLFAPPVTDPVA